ncbi:hypothetical protein [Streptomyces sp. NPDC004267]|uniref:hypothetical protein n=1 Tax=Streptomyces sp. NPDC004267 TaxID=3364694 RepID=UPI0036B72CBF
MIDIIDVAPLGRTLLGAGAGLRWTGAEPRALADRLGLSAEHMADSPLELVVPVSRPDAEPLAQAREFRRVADALRAVLGDATHLGAHGHTRPFGRRTDPVWGRPFLRWCEDGTTLELRAGAAGPELVLQPTGPWEEWYALSGTGFTGTLESSGQELDHPNWEGHGDDWESLRSSLGAFLRTLPAETVALGVAHSMPLYGMIDDRGPLLFDIVCDDRLFLGFTEYQVRAQATGEHAAALGWTRRESLPPGHLTHALDGEPPWRVAAGGPGEVDAPEMSALLVRTARAAGVAGPGDLILGGEGEFRHPYRFRFPGLAMRVG